ncbi:MAG: DUF192 domain-containing protein [Rhodobacteraceae bacterium]|nr:DUF192 domain-containing protein [Paracoccaceae bacterium]
MAELRWDGGPGARFRVEIADTPAERSRGLMFRDSLPDGAGMLFVYPAPGEVAFWMKNTLIPLDMIFIGPDGRVNGIRAMAAPGDLTPVPGPPGTQFVLEIGGGVAGRLGLREGAELRHPAVDPAAALWPCGA